MIDETPEYQERMAASIIKVLDAVANLQKASNKVIEERLVSLLEQMTEILRQHEFRIREITAALKNPGPDMTNWNGPDA